MQTDTFTIPSISISTFFPTSYIDRLGSDTIAHMFRLEPVKRHQSNGERLYFDFVGTAVALTRHAVEHAPEFVIVEPTHFRQLVNFYYYYLRDMVESRRQAGNPLSSAVPYYFNDNDTVSLAYHRAVPLMAVVGTGPRGAVLSGPAGVGDDDNYRFFDIRWDRPNGKARVRHRVVKKRPRVTKHLDVWQVDVQSLTARRLDVRKGKADLIEQHPFERKQAGAIVRKLMGMGYRYNSKMSKHGDVAILEKQEQKYD